MNIFWCSGDYVPWEGYEPVVRDQDLEEGGHHQEGRSRAHDDRKESFAGSQFVKKIIRFS